MRIYGRQHTNDIRRPSNSLVRFGVVTRFPASLAFGLLLAYFTPGLLFGQQAPQASPLTLQQAVNIGREVAYVRLAEMVISSKIADPLMGESASGMPKTSR
jgi:hypothetical protein